MIPLACTVRGCGQPLARHGRTWTCARGHAYDEARSGYVNLLQPQDRKSASAGDSKDAVDARARLLSRGVGRMLVDEIVRRATALASGDARSPSVVADLGCGPGDVLGTLTAARQFDAVGIDLSTAAVDFAARRFPLVTWVVANADRRLPLADDSVDVVLSIHGRRHPRECARVLKPGGWVIAAVPAADDLVELRERLHGARLDRDRAEAFVAEHSPFFGVRERAVVRERARLDVEAVHDLLRGTYRGARRSESDRVDALGPMDVTLASDVLMLQWAGRAGGAGRAGR
ncbi:MAG TPA: methyltransferase domain-containing protein [Vicinamibacterales bacterium]|nr:methyltransferase domain-containing protein [Vicinamibacterales bacterium]